MLRYLLFTHIIGTLCLLGLCAQNVFAFAHSGSDVSGPMLELKLRLMSGEQDDKQVQTISEALTTAESEISKRVDQRHGSAEGSLIIALVSGILALLSLMMLFSWPPAHLEKPNQKSGI